MRICIPTQTNEGSKATLCDHFGSAPCFLIYDTDKGTFEAIANSEEHHTHGMCHPLKALKNHNIGAVVCRGMGARAIQKLNEAGIKAYRTVAETAEEVTTNYKQGTLEEMTLADCCTDHSCH